jgi:hypothetical protein
VDRWFDQADHPLDAAMRRARDIILGADGRITESIKWKTPTFAYQGNIVSFNPSKHVVSLMFHVSPGRRDPGRPSPPGGRRPAGPDHALQRPGPARGGRADLEAVIRAWCDWKAGSPAPG